jgi:DNA-binding MarR family transcriptional regulator
MTAINKTLRKEITKRMDKVSLTELRRALIQDVENEKNEVNKVVLKYVYKLTEEEFQAEKVIRLKYFDKVKALIDKRLKELA